MPYLHVTFLDEESLNNFPIELDTFLSDGKNYVANFSFPQPKPTDYSEKDFLIQAEYPVIEATLKKATEKYENFKLHITDFPTIRYIKWTVISEEN
jgi:hypothetical protein